MIYKKKSKLEKDLDTYRLLCAVQASAQAVIALKSKISIEEIQLKPSGEFELKMAHGSLSSLDSKEQVDLYISSLVASNMFLEFYRELDFYDLFIDVHGAHNGMMIRWAIENYKATLPPVTIDDFEIRKITYDRIYRYLKPRFSSLVALSCNLAVASTLNSDEIARHFFEIEL